MTPRDLFTLDAIHPWLIANAYQPRDLGLLAAALDRPWVTFGGAELYPDVWVKTAALISSVEASHPLVDGNKRLGVLLGHLMLRTSGIDDLRVSDDDWFDLIIAVATNHPDVDVLAARLQSLYTWPAADSADSADIPGEDHR